MTSTIGGAFRGLSALRAGDVLLLDGRETAGEAVALCVGVTPGRGFNPPPPSPVIDKAPAGIWAESKVQRCDCSGGLWRRRGLSSIKTLLSLC